MTKLRMGNLLLYPVQAPEPSEVPAAFYLATGRICASRCGVSGLFTVGPPLSAEPLGAAWVIAWLALGEILGVSPERIAEALRH